MGPTSLKASRILRLPSLGVVTDMSVFDQCRMFWYLLLTEVVKWRILF